MPLDSSFKELLTNVGDQFSAAEVSFVEKYQDGFRTKNEIRMSLRYQYY